MGVIVKLTKGSKHLKKSRSSTATPLSLEHVEERLNKSILSAALALYILRNSTEPTSKLIKELIQIEIEVGKFVGQALEMHIKRTKMFWRKSGFLAGALSFIPMRSRRNGVNRS